MEYPTNVKERTTGAVQAASERTASAVGAATEIIGNATANAMEPVVIPEERKNREAIIQGLLQGRVVWYFGFWQDFWFYVKQTHVVIGIFLAHSMHPYSKLERMGVWLSSAVAGFGLSMMLLDETGEKKQDAAVIAAGISASIVLAIMNLIMVQCMTCSCIQEGSSCFKCAGDRGRSAAENVGWCLGAVGWIFALIFLGGGFLFRKAPLAIVIRAFVVSQGFSFLLGLGTGMLMFMLAYYGCCGCCSGQAGADRVKTSSPYPYGAEYPKDRNMFQAGDSCNLVCCCGEATMV